MVLKYKAETRYLGEVALLVDKCQDVKRLVGQHVQCSLVVVVIDVLPDDVLAGVLVLLQLEDVLHKELLQLLVGEVDAQLLKTVTKRANDPHNNQKIGWDTL